MADQPNDSASGLFSLDARLDAGFLCDGSEPAKSDPSSLSSVGHQTSSYFADHNWNFQTTPPYEPYEQPYDPSVLPQPSQQHTNNEQHVPFTASSWHYSTPLVSAPVADHYSDVSLSPPPFPSGSMPQNLIDSPIDPPLHAQHQHPPPSTLAIGSDPLRILTPAQQNELRAIAMPVHLQYQSPTSEPSPDSATSDVKAVASFSSPETAESSSKYRKRKMEQDVDVDPDEYDDDDDSTHPVKKTAHNMIEKRYRNNLNDKIAALRDSVPSLRIMSKSARGEDTTEDREELHGLTPAHKLNKATILSKATEYIRHLEKRNARLMDENESMQGRIAAFEKLVMGGAMPGLMGTAQPGPSMQFETLAYVSTPMETPRDSNPPSMMPGPESMKQMMGQQIPAQAFGVSQPAFPPSAAIIRQQQLQKQQQSQQNHWVNAGPYFGKLMAGSMAGLMFIGAMRENEPSSETTDGRGLFAIPFHLLGRIFGGDGSHVNIMGHHFSRSCMIRYVEAIISAAVFLWVFIPFVLLYARPPKKAKAVSSTLPTAPSLASPIRVRRQAWLTAIQTVWVPEHNFFLEAAALVLKAMKLSLRNAIGVRGYQLLTGLTEEQESARVKAWTVALDAQLAGGDVEINKGRLTLTLLASQTLPTTPLRLMMQALHVRVLLWDVVRGGSHSGITNMVAAKLARTRWNDARQLNRIMTQLRRSAPQPDDEPLPDHLAALLELECDDVLNNTVVLRAYNLGWNRPTMLETVAKVDGMDEVVDDVAIRSPLDAVAAWRCCQLLHEASKARLGVLTADTDPSVCDMIQLALKIAPVGSTAHARALVSRAVIVSQGRGASIAAALQVVGTDQIAQGTVTTDPSSLARPDFRVPLLCALALAHLARASANANASDSSPGPRIISTISFVEPGAKMSLLGCAAAYQLMEQMWAHKSTAGVGVFGSDLERLSGDLRIWIGGRDGARCGLGRKLRGRLVERCLEVTKSAVGMEGDPGYGTMSGTEDDIEEACMSLL